MYRVILLSVLILSLLGCGHLFKPPTEQRYAKEGISFTHHSNWRVTEDAPPEDDPSARTINVEGPNEAIVMFIFVPPESDVTAESFAAGVARDRFELLKEVKIGPIKPAELTDTKSEPVTSRIGGRVQNGVLQRFSIKMLGQLVPHEARFFMVENERVKVVIMTQVATEDVRDTAPEFDLILDTLSLS